MKLNIIFKDENAIGNYQNIALNSKTHQSELEEIPQQSCEEIIITDAINRIEEGEALNVIQLCASKLKIGGQIILTIVDFNTLCAAQSSGQINHDTFNSIISTSKCVIEYSYILQFFLENNIKLISSQTANLLYTIDGKKDAS